MKTYKISFLFLAILAIAGCKREGCTDPLAVNYDEKAKKDDGSCILASVQPELLNCQRFSTSGETYVLPDRGPGIDYIIDCKMPVNGDLTIMPGVTIAFESDAGLIINDAGSLSATATSALPILFTGVDKVKGSWAGIMFYANDVKNKLDGVKIEYAGGTSFNSNGDLGSVILYADSRAEIRNCNIILGEAYGINANYGDGNFVFSNNTITTCDVPMFLQAKYCSAISGGTFTGNTTDVIYIDTYASDGVVPNTQTWPNPGIPYRVKAGGRIIISDGNLTISPGTVMEFETGSGIRINDNSSLKALGTANNKIIFTGVDKVAGSWDGIYFSFTQSALNEIGFALIEYGGANNFDGAIYMWANPRVNIHDVEFKDIQACAFYDAPKSNASAQVVNPNLTMTNNTVTSVSNQNGSDTLPGNSSYCFGG